MFKLFANSNLYEFATPVLLDKTNASMLLKSDLLAPSVTVLIW